MYREIRRMINQINSCCKPVLWQNHFRETFRNLTSQETSCFLLNMWSYYRDGKKSPQLDCVGSQDETVRVFPSYSFQIKVAPYTYVVGSKSFRPDIQKPRQMENAVSEI